MISIAHLDHCSQGIWCTRCNKPFPISARVMGDPHEVLQAKERIAAVHVCGSRSTVQREAEYTATRVIRPAEVVSIDRH